MKTFMAKKNEVEQKWLLVDADGAILGRMAAKIAPLLMGKNKPEYTPHVDVGDYVIVVNAEKLRVTGKKADQRTYFSHSGHPGAGKHVTVRTMMETRPQEVVKRAVRGMLPKNKLGRKMLKKLRVYAGPNHPHQAQSPEPLEL